MSGDIHPSAGVSAGRHQADSCAHVRTSCLNPYELIRKYRCGDCDAVMMCSCDEAFARRFLGHQLAEGVELETQLRVPVTLGFRPGICSPCQGLPAVAAPPAAIPGRMTKLKRYYWRELFVLEWERMADWEADHPEAGEEEVAEARARIAREALEEIQAGHKVAPTYDMREPSQAEVIARYGVEIDSFRPEFAASPQKGAVVMWEGKVMSPELYAAHQYARDGWSAMPLESAPLHALFAVLLHPLIEHPSDPRTRLVSFGSRTAYEERRPGESIHLRLPEDFGTPGYGRRQSAAIDAHFAFLMPDGYPDRGALLDLFDAWRRPSVNLRQYLWAHREEDVDRARRLLDMLAPARIHVILRYLVEDYWGHYIGWPDLLLHRGDDICLVEVKSPSDKLSAEQRRWIADNHDRLKLPFRLAKLHRPSRQASPKPGSRDAADD